MISSLTAGTIFCYLVRMNKYCPECHRSMQRWGKTKAGTTRFFCPACKKTTTSLRKDLTEEHIHQRLDKWLAGKDSLEFIAKKDHLTRQALWKEFQPFFKSVAESSIFPTSPIKYLVVDGTYIHGNKLCVLVAINERREIAWQFAPYESYASWWRFLISLPEPEVVVMDGQKGLFAAVTKLWPNAKIQRCQFHVISLAFQYMGRRPKEEAGIAMAKLLYQLKEVRSREAKKHWLMMVKIWEKQYDFKIFRERDEYGKFKYQRLRSVRYIMRKATPYLFTYLDYPGVPNTTNLVEGWVNSAIAEALRLHRGLRIHEKKMLVGIILRKISQKADKSSVPEDIDKNDQITL
jgi:hypothetical protein